MANLAKVRLATMEACNARRSPEPILSCVTLCRPHLRIRSVANSTVTKTGTSVREIEERVSHQRFCRLAQHSRDETIRRLKIAHPCLKLGNVASPALIPKRVVCFPSIHYRSNWVRVVPLHCQSRDSHLTFIRLCFWLLRHLLGLDAFQQDRGRFLIVILFD